MLRGGKQESFSLATLNGDSAQPIEWFHRIMGYHSLALLALVLFDCGHPGKKTLPGESGETLAGRKAT